MPSRYSYDHDDDISTLSSTTVGRRYKQSNILFDTTSSSEKSSRRQTIQYIIIGFLALLIVIFRASDLILATNVYNIPANYNSARTIAATRTANEPPRGGHLEPYAAYITLQHPQDVDLTVEHRANEIASYYLNHPSEYNARCNNLMIYMPDAFAFHGHGSQINTYLMAVLVSTYLDRPLLLLEPEGEYNKYEGGSQFGCPEDFHKGMPSGLSRLLDHPVWLHNGCVIPKCHEYRVWNQMSGTFRPQGSECKDANTGRIVNTIVARGSPLRGYMREMSSEMMSNSNTDASLKWALNLGATREEAQRFVEMKRAKDKWDYVIALMVKSGVLKLQPWIARDVQKFLQNIDLSIDSEYDGIHVRRGDKLVSESRAPVVDYWLRQGYTEQTMPLDYIPFSHYLTRWSKEECNLNGGERTEILQHHVYVATDDPVVVKLEIDKLIAENVEPLNNQHGVGPKKETSLPLTYNNCHQFTFYFNPTQDTSFHLGGNGERNPIDGDTCSSRYYRNIVSMADFLMLARSQTFVGEYNSNWGRLLRIARMRLAHVDPFSKILDTRVAWGRDFIAGPGL